MDKQSQQILERVLSEKNNNPTNKNQKVPLLGGSWNENSEFLRICVSAWLEDGEN